MKSLETGVARSIGNNYTLFWGNWLGIFPNKKAIELEKTAAKGSQRVPNGVVFRFGIARN